MANPKISNAEPFSSLKDFVPQFSVVSKLLSSTTHPYGS